MKIELRRSKLESAPKQVHGTINAQFTSRFSMIKINCFTLGVLPTGRVRIIFF